LVGELDDLVRATATTAQVTSRATEQLLVVAIGHGRRVAIPLADVTRLEHLPAERVERVGSREVVQYRGELVPVARLDAVLGAEPAGNPERLLVTVLTREDRTVAVVVG